METLKPIIKQKVLLLGGYGVFGQIIATAISKQEYIELIIAGRNLTKAQKFASSIKATAVQINVHETLKESLEQLAPYIVINACGPFQGQNYKVPLACIEQGIHYIDLADARDYVVGLDILNKQAKEKNVTIISGASTVPGLSSAVLEKYHKKFSQIDSLVFGITPGAKATRGVATAQGIMSYLGKPLKPWAGNKVIRYGWQDLYRQQYPELGVRWMANCDIPDLDLFNERYGIKEIKFSAGMENIFLHFGMWGMSWLVRFGLKLNLAKYATGLLKFSRIFDAFGSANGGMHMIIKGKDMYGASKELKWFIIAYNDGPNIPTIPAIILTKKLISKNFTLTGAFPCVGIITLDEYMDELKYYSIKQIVEESSAVPDISSEKAEYSSSKFSKESLYKRILGPNYLILPKTIQELHDYKGQVTYQGKCYVKRGNNYLAIKLADLLSIPKANDDVDVTVNFKEYGKKEIWNRSFNGKNFRSIQWQVGNLLYEKIKFITLVFKIIVTGNGLELKLQKSFLLGIPLTPFLNPKIIATETEIDGKFCFFVQVSLPLLGMIVQYKGYLQRFIVNTNKSLVCQTSGSPVLT